MLVNVKANSGTGAGVIKLILEERGELQTMELDQDAITIGRTADNAVRVADALSSRHHCRISRTPDGWRVEDLNSRNGTTLNGQRIEGKRVLAVGDQVAIGESVIHFGARLEKPAKSAPPAKQKSQKVAKPAAAAPVAAVAAPAPTGRKARFVLKGTDGLKSGKALGIPSFPFTIGRKKGAGLVLEDEEVSNEHCMLVEDEGAVHVVDLNSDTGTFVSGKRVKGREKLPPNAILAVGGSKFRFKDLAAKGVDAASDDNLEAAEAPTIKVAANAAMPAPVDEVKDLDALGEDDDSDPAATPSKGTKRPASAAKEKTGRKPKAAPAPAGPVDASALGGDETGIATTEFSSIALEQGAGGGAGGAIAIILAVIALLAAAVPVAHAFLGTEDRDPEPAENRVSNWSFEQRPALRDWKTEGAVKVVTDGVQHGTRAVRVDAAQDGRGELRASEAYRVPQGKALTLHASIKTQGQAAAVLAIEWTDELAPSWKELGFAAIVEGATAWADGGMTLSPPQRATHGRAVAFAVPLGAAASGAAFFDRIFLREEEVKDPLPALRGAGLDVVATPRGVLHLVRPGQNGAPATQLARVYVALAAADGTRGDPLATQLGWAPTTPAGDPGDGGIFADGTILDTASGDRIAAGVVVKPVGDSFKLWWEVAKKDLPEKRPLRIVLDVAHLKEISPVELQSQSGATTTLDQAFTKAGASFIRLEGINEIAWGSGADQASIHMSAVALEAERVGDGVRFELVGVPEVKGDLRLLGFDLAKASSLASGRIRELLAQAATARKDGRLEDARQAYLRLAREFSHDPSVAGRARRDADALATQADRLLEAVNAAAEDGDELGLPELDRAAHTWADALAKAFPGAPQLAKANAAVARADERLEKNKNAAKGVRARDLVARAVRHREAHRNALARTIYEYILASFPADDPAVKDAKERLAAMPPATGEGE